MNIGKNLPNVQGLAVLSFFRTLCVLGLCVGLLSTFGVSSISAQERTPQTQSIDEALGLALKGVSLVNGENGIELWRLKASWAHLEQEGENILVDQPVVRYTLGDPTQEDYLDVRADKGRITENQRYVDLWGHVVITRAEETLTTSRTQYDSQSRIMSFPEGVRFEAPKSFGTASVVSWNLNTNAIESTNGVELVLKAQQ